MATTTAVSIELRRQAQESASLPADEHYTDPAVNDDDDVRDMLEASRLADATVPDGGYGWVVIASCAVITWWFVGTTYCWGVIQSALVDQGLSSASTLSYIGSLAVAAVSFMALINAQIIRKIGAQKTGMLGITLVGVSEILSSLTVESVAGLFITNGCLLGLGVSLCFMTVSATPAQYFNRNRGLANGIVFAGGGLGGAVTSFALDFMIRDVGVPWTFRILGLSTLATGLPAAWFIKERVPIKSTSFVEWSLFKDVKFLVIFLSGAIATFPLLVPPFFLPLYCSSIGLSSSTGAGLLAAFNFASAAGRIFCGYFCDTIGSLNTLFFCMLLNAISMLGIWPASTALGPLVVFTVLNGAANGGFFATMPTVVGNVFGSQRMSVAMGMIVTAWAGGYLMGSPVAGYLLEQYGGVDAGLEAYRPAMYYAGSMALGAAGLVALARIRAAPRLLVKI